MSRAILALNCGSSSLKFGLYSVDGAGIQLLFEGEGEEIGKPEATFWFKQEGQPKQEEQSTLRDHQAVLERALQRLKQNKAPDFAAVGHRIVHGGPQIVNHQLLTPAVLKELQAAVEFAPLHVPAALKAIAAVSAHLPQLPQVVCLDTAFHTTMPDVSRYFALPSKVRDLGVHRYGFHGLSLESILPQLSVIPDRLVVAHLGGGCSVTAIHKGQSVDTTMGLTPTGGMMMGTRCGDLDPGVLLYLLRNGFPDAGKLEELCDHNSGLEGVSGFTSDMRALEKARSTNPQADLALRMFAHQLQKAVAAMAASAGGLDLLVFTGGIGEHDAALREKICRNLSFLGEFENRALPAEEDLQIARITARLTTA